MIDFAASGRIY